MDYTSIFNQNNGYARMKDLKLAGIHTRTIAGAVQSGNIIRIKPGLYKLADFYQDEFSGFVDVCAANSKSIICLVSAAEYYELTTFNPAKISAALPDNAAKPRAYTLPVKFFYFRGVHYTTEIKSVKAKSGIFRIYSVEKTVADLFRYYNKIGSDIALEVIKNYLKRKDKDINKLIKIGESCGAKKLNQVLEALLG